MLKFTDKVRDALDSGSSMTVAKLMAEAEAAAIKADARRAAARKRALDPRCPDDEVAVARREAEDAEFEAERLRNTLEVLKGKRQEFAEAEQNAQRQAAYDAAIAQRDSVAIRLRDRYPALANELGELLQAVADANSAIAAVNAKLPAGAYRLDDVEHQVRPKPRSQYEAPAPLTTGVRLPAWDRSRDAPIYGPSGRVGDGRKFNAEPTAAPRLYLEDERTAA